MRTNSLKTAFNLSALCLVIAYSSSANAASPANLRGWTFGVGFPYLQFSNNGTIYAKSFNDQSFNVSPDYHLGINLFATYHTRQGTDINFNYTHLRASDWSSVEDTITSPTDLDFASASNSYDYDSFDVTGGHLIPLTQNFNVNYFGGFNFTHLARDMNIFGSGLNSYYANVGTSFNGFGPKFGLNGTCNPMIDMFPRLRVVGGVDAAFLYGTITSYDRVHLDQQEPIVDIIPNEKIVVPAVGGNIGVKYELPYYNGVKSWAELGYESKVYFNVIQDRSYSGADLDASLQGFYLNLSAEVM